MGFVWQRFLPVAAGDCDDIFAHIATEHFDAVYIHADPLSNQPEDVTRVSQLAQLHRIPAIGENLHLGKAGLLLTYNQDYEQDLSRVLRYVDKLLRNIEPSELPVEQSTRFS
jgi:ABC-type uncharacterized transport system substrate-binding protein